MEQAQTDEECDEYEGSDEEDTDSSVNVHAPVQPPPAWKRVWLQFLFFGQFSPAPYLTSGLPAFFASVASALAAGTMSLWPRLHA